jgi:hypothetical protein
MTPDVCLEWGHLVLDPDGREIRVPAKAIVKLRRLGLLIKRRGTPQISAFIYRLLGSEYDALTDGLRSLLGEDVSGPEWLVCHCGTCKRERDSIYHELEQLGLFRTFMFQASASS